MILPYIDQENVWKRFTDPAINGTSYPMIVRGGKPTVTTHNLIRGQRVSAGVMQTQVPVFNYPSRQPRVVRSQDGDSVAEGVASDYGVNYGSSTSAVENDGGAFLYSCGPCGTGQKILNLTNVSSNTIPRRREARHADRAGGVRRDDGGGARFLDLLRAPR